MTRKKWNRLRRQRPELVNGLHLMAWEKHSPAELGVLTKASKRDLVAVLSYAQMLRSTNPNINTVQLFKLCGGTGE